MNRIRTSLLSCPHCDSLSTLWGEQPNGVSSPENPELDVLDAAREFALVLDAQPEHVICDGEYRRSLAKLRDACTTMLAHDLQFDALRLQVQREASNWLLTLTQQEALVFAVVTLRGLLKRRPAPSGRTLSDALVAAQNAVLDWRDEQRTLAYAMDRDAWIRGYGSRRLKLILAEGFAATSDAAYRDERLRKERPGWGWSEPGGRRLGTMSEPRNPPMAAFTLLNEARKVAPDAQLHYLDRKALGRRYIATSPFLGRVAVYPALDAG